MTKTLLEAFEEILGHLVFDQNLARGLYNYRVGYITQNREHMEFFGGNLLGVNIVRFKTTDENRFFELLDVPYPEVISCVREVTTIDHSFKVAGDVINLTLMYLIHKFMNSRKITEGIRKQVLLDIALIFFYRCSAILISANFKYPADPKVAQMAYANLSQKYLIKKLGSWNKVMDYRARALYEPGAPHLKSLSFFNEDNKIQYAISDSQGRIREMFKGYYSEFMMVHEEGQSVAVQKATSIDAEGEEGLKEKTLGPENFVFYMRSILSDPASFIREDLLGIIAKNNTNTSPRAIRFTLDWIAVETSQPKFHKVIDTFITRVVVQAIYFMEYNIEPNKRKDLAYVLSNLKNLFLSTRSIDPDLVQLRELGEEIITLAHGKLSSSLMMATRTAVIMYICLRALVGKNSN